MGLSCCPEPEIEMSFVRFDSMVQQAVSSWKILLITTSGYHTFPSQLAASPHNHQGNLYFSIFQIKKQYY